MLGRALVRCQWCAGVLVRSGSRVRWRPFGSAATAESGMLRVHCGSPDGSARGAVLTGGTSVCGTRGTRGTCGLVAPPSGGVEEGDGAVRSPQLLPFYFFRLCLRVREPSALRHAGSPLARLKEPWEGNLTRPALQSSLLLLTACPPSFLCRLPPAWATPAEITQRLLQLHARRSVRGGR